MFHRTFLLLMLMMVAEMLPAVTSPAPILIKDINPGTGNSNIMSMVDMNGILYFSANDGVHGQELWRSDGTAAGTILVKDINPGSGDGIHGGLAVFNGRLIFNATSGTATGDEPWISDGTATGTTLLKDIASGSGSSEPFLFTPVNNQCFFLADSTGGANSQLWVTNGTTAGTTLVKSTPWLPDGPNSNHPNHLTDSGLGFLYFTGNDSVNGQKLWRSDGTAAGTIPIITNSVPRDQRGDQPWKAKDGVLYFANGAGSGNSTFWRSDGTSAGTHALGANLNFPTEITFPNGSVFFTAQDTTVGFEPRVSNDTVAGTVLIKDIRPGTSSSDWPYGLTGFLSRTYFAESNVTNGYELWASDGTTAGTTMVKDINVGSGDASPDSLTVVGNKLYFTAFDGSNLALWVSDGTSAGTQLVPGTVAMGVGELVASGDQKLYFTATDSSHGRELWSLTNQAPTVATQALATPSPVTGTRGELMVLGADDGGESNLVYTWATTGTVPAPVTFSDNGTNVAKQTNVTFAKSGSYTFQVTIKDRGNLTVTSNVTVVVNATPSTVAITPTAAAVPTSSTRSFSAKVLDQFALALTSQPSFTWSGGSGGTINSTTGLFTAGSSPSQVSEILATASTGLVGSAAVQVISSSTIGLKINFQPTTAAIPTGYSVDDGSLNGPRANGFIYGWNVNHTDVTRKRSVNADERLDTLCHFHAGGIWSIAIPNGAYTVLASIGDPSNASTHTLIVGGVTYWSALPLAANQFANMTKTVTVTNGTLSVSEGGAAEMATRINFLEITSATGAVITTVIGPTLVAVGATSTYTINLSGPAGSHSISLSSNAHFSDGTTSKTQSSPSSASYSVIVASGGGVDFHTDGAITQSIFGANITLPDFVRSATIPTLYSIPVNIPTNLTVTIAPPLAGHTIFFRVEPMAGGTPGSAHVSANATLNGPGGTITVTGDDQSDNGGHCHLVGYADGNVNGTDLIVGNGFTICTHMHQVQLSTFTEINDSRLGIFVYEDFFGDTAGTAYFLQNRLATLEHVPSVPDHPGDPPIHFNGIKKQPGYTFIDPDPTQRIDIHAIPRGIIDNPPSQENNLLLSQTHTFFCARCGARDIPVPAAGFHINARVFKGYFNTWVFTTEKSGADATVDGFHCTPGTGDITSSEMNLP